MARRRNTAAVLERTMSVSEWVPPSGQRTVRIPRKKGKPVTPAAIAKYLKVKALRDSAKALGNFGEAQAAQATLDRLEETYPGIGEKSKKGKSKESKERSRASYTQESSAEALSAVAKKAAKKATSLRKHKIVVEMPDGSKFEAKGYATVRAANIDAKKMVLEVKRVFERALGAPKGTFPVRTEYNEVEDEESGYTLSAAGKHSEALRRNPRLRHNTHLPVGTSVDYKGKAAKVVKQHEHDVYTVRFATTGKSMRVPGFLLERR